MRDIMVAPKMKAALPSHRPRRAKRGVGRAQTCLSGLARTLIAQDWLREQNYGIGIGHTFGFLKKDPIGDELTFGYTYENAGTHGLLHTDSGEHTECVGLMKNFALPKTKLVSDYT
jgi:hypothetical protein